MKYKENTPMFFNAVVGKNPTTQIEGIIDSFEKELELGKNGSPFSHQDKTKSACPQVMKIMSTALLFLSQECDRLREEVEETLAAYLNKDKKEFIDGIGDISFILTNIEDFEQAFGTLESIREFLDVVSEKTSLNVSSLVSDISLNNNLKFTTDYDLAHSWLMEHQVALDDEALSYELQSNVYEGVTYFFIKDTTNGKIIKPIGHPKPDLTKYVDEFKESDTFELGVTVDSLLEDKVN